MITCVWTWEEAGNSWWLVGPLAHSPLHRGLLQQGRGAAGPLSPGHWKASDGLLGNVGQAV